jgi:hypothetical protein
MTTPPDAKPGTAPEAERIKTIDEKLAAVKDDVLAAVRDMIGGAKSAESHAQAGAQQREQAKLDRPTEAGQDIGAMVDAAIGKVLGDKERAEQDRKHAEQHARLEQAASEKTPIERTWRHRIWGGD